MNDLLWENYAAAMRRLGFVINSVWGNDGWPTFKRVQQ